MLLHGSWSRPLPPRHGQCLKQGGCFLKACRMAVGGARVCVLLQHQCSISAPTELRRAWVVGRGPWAVGRSSHDQLYQTQSLTRRCMRARPVALVQAPYVDERIDRNASHHPNGFVSNWGSTPHHTTPAGRQTRACAPPPPTPGSVLSAPMRKDTVYGGVGLCHRCFCCAVRWKRRGGGGALASQQGLVLSVPWLTHAGLAQHTQHVPTHAPTVPPTLHANTHAPPTCYLAGTCCWGSSGTVRC